jgi:hypothetical protein
MCTATDDGIAHTHDDARALIAGAALGARLVITPKTERSAGYEIHVRRHGRPTLCVLGSYTLPAPADRIASNAREQVERAMK